MVGSLLKSTSRIFASNFSFDLTVLCYRVQYYMIGRFPENINTVKQHKKSYRAIATPRNLNLKGTTRLLNNFVYYSVSFLL